MENRLKIRHLFRPITRRRIRINIIFINTPESHTLQLLEDHLAAFKAEGRRLFATSSFQTQSVPLLHMLGTRFPEVAILFLDTGFLFPETYRFQELLAAKWNLTVHTLHSGISPHQQIDAETGLFQYALNPDRCCYLNKVKPLADFLRSGDVWISGVRRDQTAIRHEMKVQEEGKDGILKFHPMLDWSKQAIYQYISRYDLPHHPLEAAGYVSIGCIPCTYKWAAGNERGGRWVGSKKTECGLHVSGK